MSGHVRILGFALVGAIVCAVILSTDAVAQSNFRGGYGYWGGGRSIQYGSGISTPIGKGGGFQGFNSTRPPVASSSHYFTNPVPPPVAYPVRQTMTNASYYGTNPVRPPVMSPVTNPVPPPVANPVRQTMTNTSYYGTNPVTPPVTSSSHYFTNPVPPPVTSPVSTPVTAPNYVTPVSSPYPVTPSVTPPVTSGDPVMPEPISGYPVTPAITPAVTSGYPVTPSVTPPVTLGDPVTFSLPATYYWPSVTIWGQPVRSGGSPTLTVINLSTGEITVVIDMGLTAYGQNPVTGQQGISAVVYKSFLGAIRVPSYYGRNIAIYPIRTRI